MALCWMLKDSLSCIQGCGSVVVGNLFATSHITTARGMRPSLAAACLRAFAVECVTSAAASVLRRLRIRGAFVEDVMVSSPVRRPNLSSVEPIFTVPSGNPLSTSPFQVPTSAIVANSRILNHLTYRGSWLIPYGAAWPRGMVSTSPIDGVVRVREFRSSTLRGVAAWYFGRICDGLLDVDSAFLVAGALPHADQARGFIMAAVHEEGRLLRHPEQLSKLLLAMRTECAVAALSELIPPASGQLCDSGIAAHPWVDMTTISYVIARRDSIVHRSAAVRLGWRWLLGPSALLRTSSDQAAAFHVVVPLLLSAGSECQVTIEDRDIQQSMQFILETRSSASRAMKLLDGTLSTARGQHVTLAEFMAGLQRSGQWLEALRAYWLGSPQSMTQDAEATRLALLSYALIAGVPDVVQLSAKFNLPVGPAVDAALDIGDVLSAWQLLSQSSLLQQRNCSRRHVLAVVRGLAASTVWSNDASWRNVLGLVKSHCLPLGPAEALWLVEFLARRGQWAMACHLGVPIVLAGGPQHAAAAVRVPVLLSAADAPWDVVRCVLTLLRHGGTTKERLRSALVLCAAQHGRWRDALSAHGHLDVDDTSLVTAAWRLPPFVTVSHRNETLRNWQSVIRGGGWREAIGVVAANAALRELNYMPQHWEAALALCPLNPLPEGAVRRLSDVSDLLAIVRTLLRSQGALWQCALQRVWPVVVKRCEGASMVPLTVSLIAQLCDAGLTVAAINALIAAGSSRLARNVHEAAFVIHSAPVNRPSQLTSSLILDGMLTRHAWNDALRSLVPLSPTQLRPPPLASLACRALLEATAKQVSCSNRLLFFIDVNLVGGRGGGGTLSLAFDVRDDERLPFRDDLVDEAIGANHASPPSMRSWEYALRFLLQQNAFDPSTQLLPNLARSLGCAPPFVVAHLRRLCSPWDRHAVPMWEALLRASAESGNWQLAAAVVTESASCGLTLPFEKIVECTDTLMAGPLGRGELPPHAARHLLFSVKTSLGAAVALRILVARAARRIEASPAQSAWAEALNLLRLIEGLDLPQLPDAALRACLSHDNQLPVLLQLLTSLQRIQTSTPIAREAPILNRGSLQQLVSVSESCGLQCSIDAVFFADDGSTEVSASTDFLIATNRSSASAIALPTDEQKEPATISHKSVAHAVGTWHVLRRVVGRLLPRPVREGHGGRGRTLPIDRVHLALRPQRWQLCLSLLSRFHKRHYDDFAAGASHADAMRYRSVVRRTTLQAVVHGGCHGALALFYRDCDRLVADVTGVPPASDQVSRMSDFDTFFGTDAAGSPRPGGTYLDKFEDAHTRLGPPPVACYLGLAVTVLASADRAFWCRTLQVIRDLRAHHPQLDRHAQQDAALLAAAALFHGRDKVAAQTVLISCGVTLRSLARSRSAASCRSEIPFRSASIANSRLECWRHPALFVSRVLADQ